MNPNTPHCKKPNGSSKSLRMRCRVLDESPDALNEGLDCMIGHATATTGGNVPLH